MENTFDNFLQGVMMIDEPESVRTKDTFEDDFSDWVSRLDAQEIIDYAETWGEAIKTQTATDVTKLICKNFEISGLVN